MGEQFLARAGSLDTLRDDREVVLSSRRLDSHACDGSVGMVRTDGLSASV